MVNSDRSMKMVVDGREMGPGLAGLEEAARHWVAGALLELVKPLVSLGTMGCWW